MSAFWHRSFQVTRTHNAFINSKFIVMILVIRPQPFEKRTYIKLLALCIRDQGNKWLLFGVVECLAFYVLIFRCFFIEDPVFYTLHNLDEVAYVTRAILFKKIEWLRKYFGGRSASWLITANSFVLWHWTNIKSKCFAFTASKI